MNSSNPAIIKSMEEKCEALGGLEQGGVTFLKISLGGIFNMGDIVITSLRKIFKNFAQDGIPKYPT